MAIVSKKWTHLRYLPPAPQKTAPTSPAQTGAEGHPVCPLPVQPEATAALSTAATEHREYQEETTHEE